MKLGLGHKSDGRELKLRLLVLGLCFAGGLFVLAINLYRLMVVRYEEFLALSVDNEFRDVRVRAPRGLIRDRRGEVLVDARPSFDVFITPAFCQRCVAEVIPRLATYLAWDEPQRLRVEQMVKLAHGPQRYQPIVVDVDVTREEFDVLISHQKLLLPGVDLEAVRHRNYRTGSALAHVIGYMNEVTQDELTRLNGANVYERPPYAMGDYTGRRGIERSFESTLRGSDGWVKRVVNARGEQIRDSERDAVAPRPGNNVVLSIDARLQAEAERVFPGTAGAVVVLEAQTGFVLAVVSRPSFDPNEMTGRVSPLRLSQLSNDPLEPLNFRAAQEHYHPGSTFKVVTLLAGMRSGAFNEHSSVVCPGGYRLGSRVWRCHKDSGHGLVHARQALQMSCDTYFYKIADVLGIDPIAQVGRALGLGSITNLSVVGEVAGVMPDSAYHNRVTPGGYTKGMALNTAIGQGDVNVTPLQLAVVYAAAGNGGRVFQPQVVSEVVSPDGRVLQHFEPKLVRDVEMTPEQQFVMRDALTAVVNEPGGTAYRSRLANVKVAGKTGTAQVAKLGQVRVKKEDMPYFERDHAWFAGFAPAEEPELAIVVLNEHGGHGGSDAAPAAMAIIKKYFELKQSDGVAFSEPLAPAPHTAWPHPAPLSPAPALVARPVDAGPAPVATQKPPPVELQ